MELTKLVILKSFNLVSNFKKIGVTDIYMCPVRLYQSKFN